MLSRDEKVSEARLTAVQYAIVALCLVLGYGLWSLQVAGTEEFEELAARNRVREIPILAPRGKILDREGRVIVDNYPSFSALLLREGLRQLTEEDIAGIATGLNMTPEQIQDRIRQFARAPRFQPVFLKDDITPHELAFIEAHRDQFPELDTIMVYRRLYPKDGFAAHLIGYVGEVSEAMLNDPRWEFYSAGDIVGRSGVEQQYNDILMGKNGSRRVLVNSLGREVGRLGQVRAEPGQPLRLTIDLDIQIAAEEAMEGHVGALVAQDPRTGEVLAMVSRPTFDPNSFSVRISREEWNRLVTDEAKPLLNKAIQAQLAPGSVFKMIMAVAGTQEGVAQNLRITCGGGRSFYGRFFKCWVLNRGLSHGEVDLSKAIYQSCDTFFYVLAERLGIARIAHYAHAFGLGQKTGIDLPQEVAGVMPSEEWKIRNFKQRWYLGETISVGIGQGAVASTPIQLSRAIGGLAMGGVLRRPKVVLADQLSPEYRQMHAVDGPDEVRVAMGTGAWTVITDAMAAVVNPGGTAVSARLQDVDWGGKTGTAQVVSLTTQSKTPRETRFRDNAWFVGVMPRRNPEIVVSVLLEQGESGATAARVASQVVRAYADKQKARGLKLAGESGTVEVSAIWNSPPETPGEAPQESAVGGGVVQVPVAARPALPARAAPGLRGGR